MGSSALFGLVTLLVEVFSHDSTLSLSGFLLITTRFLLNLIEFLFYQKIIQNQHDLNFKLNQLFTQIILQRYEILFA